MEELDLKLDEDIICQVFVMFHAYYLRELDIIYLKSHCCVIKLSNKQLKTLNNTQ